MSDLSDHAQKLYEVNEKWIKQNYTFFHTCHLCGGDSFSRIESLGLKFQCNNGCGSTIFTFTEDLPEGLIDNPLALEWQKEMKKEYIKVYLRNMKS